METMTGLCLFEIFEKNYDLMINGQTTLTGLLLTVGEFSSIARLGLSCQPQTGLGLALKVFQPPKQNIISQLHNMKFLLLSCILRPENLK